MESHADGQDIQRRGFKLTKIGRICQSRGIFFSGDDDFLLATKVGIALMDEFYIVSRIGVMVGKVQEIKGFVMLFQCLNERLVIGDTAKCHGGIDVFSRNLFCRLVQRPQRRIFQSGEKHFLMLVRF